MSRHTFLSTFTGTCCSLIFIASFPDLISSFHVDPNFSISITAISQRIQSPFPTAIASKQSFFSLNSSYSDDVDKNVALQLEKAKQILEEAKAKIALQQQQQQQGTQASTGVDTDIDDKLDAKETKDVVLNKRDKVTKSTSDDTGLITTDGELMAALSKDEDWEVRSLTDVFENELKEESEVSKQLASRDVAASIRNLRISMQNEDYAKIFDKRNRFIGETD